MNVLYDRIGTVVESFSHNFKYETDFEDSIYGSWYMSPTIHGIELLTVAPFYLAMALYFGNKAVLKNEQFFGILNSMNHSRPKHTLFEKFCLITMIVSYGITITHKVLTGSEYFLLQPCHASAVLLIIIMAWPTQGNQFIPQLLFNIYLHTLWGAILALVFPDLRDHDMFGEIFNFFLEHGLILVLPFYLLTTRRYAVLPLSLDFALFSFFLYVSYHSFLLHTVSLLSGYNINYTLVSPALGFLIAIGHWYRFVMHGAAFILLFFTRYVLVESFLNMVQLKKKNL